MSKFRLFKLTALAAGLLLAFSALGLVRAQPGDDDEKKEAKEKPPTAAEVIEVASRAKEIFRVSCFECHGGPSGTQAGIKILEPKTFKRKIKPGDPEGSKLIKTISAKDDNVMPPAGNQPLTTDEVDAIRKWISVGAPDFPADGVKPIEKVEEKDGSFKDKDVAGVDYVMKKILTHVRDMRPQERRYVRYFSINHILVAGATPAELETHREAFVKAINHLSWMTKPVRPRAIDAPHNTVFALDIRDLGWHTTTFNVYRTGLKGDTSQGKSRLSLYDLALLEYPYGVIYEDSDTYDKLLIEYIEPAYLARPIPYVRADWFCSIVTQPPLYEDMLMLPYTRQELEEYLGVDSSSNVKDYTAKRAGMTVSGVSRNNRVVERHPLGKGAGAYWKSFDFRTSKGVENMFKDPIGFRESGGEFIWNLPNGLQGYYVADAKGERIDFAPTDIVTDKFAADKTVRNGLACMRCHDQGMKKFKDDIRPALVKMTPSGVNFDRRAALDLYPEKKEMDNLLQEDTERFMTSLKRTLGKDQVKEPLIPVSQRFLDKPLTLATAAGELGLMEHPRELTTMFRAPGFSTLGLVPLAAGGVVRRDAWEDYYDSVIRGLGVGVPVVPLDGLNRLDYPAGRSEVRVELKTNRAGNIFAAGDEMVITVTNKSAKAVYVELIGTGTRGRKYILTTNLTIKAGESYKFPPKGPGIEIKPRKGKEQITLLASFDRFPAGQVLRGPEKGRYVTDRVYHPFYTVTVRNGRPRINYDARSMVKRTIEIETK